MRGRGWRPAFPIGDQTAGPGLPLMSALRWDTGVQVRVGNRPVQVVAAVTNGSLSNPLVKDDNGGKQIAGRVVYQPSAGLVLGVSGGRAAYLGRAATDLLAVGSDGNFTQNAVGVDIEYSREHWLSEPRAYSASGPYRPSTRRFSILHSLRSGCSSRGSTNCGQGCMSPGGRTTLGFLM